MLYLLFNLSIGSLSAELNPLFTYINFQLQHLEAKSKLLPQKTPLHKCIKVIITYFATINSPTKPWDMSKVRQLVPVH